MRYYYSPSTDQYAKVLGEDVKNNVVIAVIDGKQQTINWDEFVGQFNQLVDVNEDSNTNQQR
ncbi:hypothetical protein [Moraxella phage Mcat17]|uniref:hypothetical protein n=1 Tax=Moraxella catarrhalis TaxID=480 RepID=UPI000722BE3C|nr:hypothetical protein [Moraxella catarrhalis]AKI27723.1 hypothetical protein [Moraxella phage Mcat17]MPW64176.1 hypothetical protein [Moraxella catarrhalis]